MSFLFGLQGRLNRAQLWGAYAIYVGVALLIVLVAYGIVAGNRGRDPTPALSVVFVAVFVAFLVSSVSVTVKRLHDRDRSGGWWWLMVFAPAVLSEIGAALAKQGPQGQPVAILFMLGSLILSIWAFIELFCLRGTNGANRYGPDPLDPVSSYEMMVPHSGGPGFPHRVAPRLEQAYAPSAPASVPNVAHREPPPLPPVPAADPADEILKLHALLEKGAISRDEYDSLKQATLRRST